MGSGCSQFAEVAENQPELLARHCTEAGLIEKSAKLWGKAGQRSLARSALIEAAEQLGRALSQITTLPSTAELRREQIKLQVGLTNALMHTKGHAAPETKASVECSRTLIDEAQTFGEPFDDPLVLFSVLYGGWVASYIAFDGVALRELAAQCLALAEKQSSTSPLMLGHRLMGSSLICTGEPDKGRAHLNKAFALYDPVEHRSLANAIWTRPSYNDFVLSVVCFLEPWLSRRCDK
jgi:hypothetical protein